MRKTITFEIALALVAMVFATVPMCASSEDPPPDLPEPDWMVEGITSEAQSEEIVEESEPT